MSIKVVRLRLLKIKALSLTKFMSIVQGDKHPFLCLDEKGSNFGSNFFRVCNLNKNGHNRSHVMEILSLPHFHLKLGIACSSK